MHMHMYSRVYEWLKLCASPTIFILSGIILDTRTESILAFHCVG